MNTSSLPQTRGFTLLEMTVVLLLMTLLASVAIRETNGLSFQVRYEQTRERLERIREAILGNPRQIINGQQAVSGFVADMGRLPVDLHELLERDFCPDRNYSKDACEEPLRSQPQWAYDPASGLWSGWRGPYLNISGSALDDDAFTDGWGRLDSDKTDQNYGWRVEDGLELNTLSPHPTNDKRMVIQSYGKNHEAGGADYDADYPSNRYSIDDTIPFTHPAPLIDQEDWLVDISGGTNVNFIKPAEKLPPVSLCSDPTKPTKATCTAPETWHGGCSNAGYYNKDSCTGAWTTCSVEDVSITTKSTCELAGGIWYGEGFGCSNQSKSNKTLCNSPDVWRSCTDDGTITTERACLDNGQIWYGDNIFSLSNRSNSAICMKIFYRKSDSSIGVLISDENITNDDVTVSNDPKLITSDGTFQTIRFAKFRDSVSGLITNNIPIGTNAIGIYKHDGTCTDIHYPADRQNPIQVDFHPRTSLPVINW